ncbi:phosphate regulon sensor histidine kinase PhoR [Pararobbsia silviterrae]|uniref:Phosphate regulon sensor protein PhoR n=1 Tax=Pararobbsia silviterrae TaxID=1792498 RepID=A0A494Y321_9BURK|nr:phosphate regulon sensor histidine kinase PhoR [Pararobbsia silviterrae]RKP56408.1 phosphate regulon sensor histidine kinase PhoR [Pararobbsia silviterrae]
MNVIWTRAMVSLLVVALIALGLGMWCRPAVAPIFLGVALVGYVVFNSIQTRRLWHALEAPAHDEVIHAPGIWGEIYYRLHKLVKRWHSQIRQVEMQHQRFIQAIQASPNGVVMLDDQNQIEWSNAIAESHFGFDTKRDLRQHITHLVRHPDFVRYLHQQRYDEDLHMRGMGENRQKVLAVQAFPYGDNRKLVLTQDITELERTDSMRRDFVANVSHELKTPLTVLSGFLETMRELPLSEADRARYLDIMAQQAARMQIIVNDLLVLAKLEGDAKPPVEHMIDMPNLLRHLRDDALGLSSGKHTIEMEADDGLTVVGAENELMSALGNLVSNAVRYTPEGGKITIRWRDTGDGAVFSVTDTGIGIPAEHIPRLTERFYRVDRSRSRDTGGTGLGLAIVKHVLQRHDALLQVKSEEGRGSEFAVRFAAARTFRDKVAAAKAI